MLKNVLLIDNYDSFTFNLVQYIGSLGARPRVVRNDQTSVQAIREEMPEAIVISPGPGIPAQAGISKAVIAEFHGNVPILGVCLGHQAIGEVFGGTVIPAREIRHGKTSPVFHSASGLFTGFTEPLQATRYHSLVVDQIGLPEGLEVTAWTEDKVIMGLQAEGEHTYGVQFHPESYATSNGLKLMENFLCCQN